MITPTPVQFLVGDWACLGNFTLLCVDGLWEREAEIDILYIQRKALILSSELTRPHAVSLNGSSYPLPPAGANYSREARG